MPLKMSTGMKTARIKFCGGCNPEYDRPAAAGRIRQKLERSGYTVMTGNGEADMAVVVCGCPCACADVSGLKSDRIVMVTGPEADEETVKKISQNILDDSGRVF